MSSIKIFFTLLIVHCTLLIGTASAQWWVQGGNLLWPYGDVTIQNNLNVEGNINGVKKYVALLTQSGTAAPVATVLENTLGGTPIWDRVGVGSYTIDYEQCALLGITSSNTGVVFQSKAMSENASVYDDGDGDLLQIITYTQNPSTLILEPSDNKLENNLIEIRVYP